MTQTKYSFKSLLVVILFTFYNAQGQTTSSKDEIYLVDYVNPLIGKYSKKISSDLVSDSFKNFKNWFLIFTIIQVTSILYYNSRPNDKKKSDFLIYVLGIFNSVFLIIMYTSLVYFTTDGFRNITM